MLMQPVRIDQILANLKDQTRRPAQPGDQALHDENGAIVAVKRNGRMLWYVSGDYALSPKRGQAGIWWNPVTRETNEAWLEECRANGMNTTIWGETASAVGGFVPLRIRITDICREDARDISEDDAKREGFQRTIDFLQVWMGFYDKPALNHLQDSINILWHGGQISGNESSERAQAFLISRPAARYDCWCLSFEIAE